MSEFVVVEKSFTCESFLFIYLNEFVNQFHIIHLKNVVLSKFLKNWQKKVYYFRSRWVDRMFTSHLVETPVTLRVSVDLLLLHHRLQKMFHFSNKVGSCWEPVNQLLKTSSIHFREAAENLSSSKHELWIVEKKEIYM